MTTKTRPPLPPVPRDPFGRDAYVRQAMLATDADAWLATQHPDAEPLPALIGRPELNDGGSRGRGSNRTEITPPFQYVEIDACDPADAVTVDGAPLLAAWSPAIDYVTQGNVDTRDRRKASNARTTFARYIGPCFAPCEPECALEHEHRDAWRRYRTTARGAIAWSDCPTPCPRKCEEDHKHCRHSHREHGATHVTSLAPYGADGLDRGTTTTATTASAVGMRWDHGAWSAPAETRTVAIGQVRSKRQGRRAKRMGMGTWSDGHAVGTVGTGAYRVVVPEVTTATLTRHFTNGRDVRAFPTSAVVELVEWVHASREHPAFDLSDHVPAAWVATVRREVIGRPPIDAPPSDLDVAASRERARRILARDEGARVLLARILAAAEQCYATGMETAPGMAGIRITFEPAEREPLRIELPTLGTTLRGSWKARKRTATSAVIALQAS